MPISRTCSLALALVAPGLLGACGGSGSTDDSSAASETVTVDKAFGARAEGVCGPYAHYNDTHFLRLTGFSRYAPDPADLPEVAAHLDRNPAYDTLMAKLAALGEPETGSAAWSAALREMRSDVALVRAETVDAGHADADGFAQHADRQSQSATDTHLALVRAGLSPGSSCIDALRDPLAGKTAAE